MFSRERLSTVLEVVVSGVALLLAWIFRSSIPAWGIGLIPVALLAFVLIFDGFDPFAGPDW
jgi:hypothetical protein